MKNNYGSSRKMLLGILVIAGLIICCIGFYRINCSAGVRPFKNLQAEELHYVSYVNGRDSKINLLDPDEYSDFTDALTLFSAPARQTGSTLDIFMYNATFLCSLFH